MSLIVDASVKTAGEDAVLSWVAENATQCTASGDWSGVKTTSGSENVGALYGNSEFELECTGPNGSASSVATTQRTPIAEAAIKDSVIELGAEAIALLAQSTDESLTFNGPVPLASGDVFIIDGTAHKVDRLETVNGQTIVYVIVPGLDEVVDELRIAGEFTVSALDWETQEPISSAKGLNELAAVQASAATAGEEFSFDFSTEIGSAVVISGSVLVGVKVTADIDFNIIDGLKKGEVVLQTNANLVDGSIGLRAASFSAASPILARARFPLPNLPIASVYVPVTLEVSGDADFELATGFGFSTSARLGTSISSSGEITGSTAFEASGLDIGQFIGQPNPLARPHEVASWQLDVRLVGKPAVVLLNTIRMIGLKMGVGPSLRGTGEYVPNGNPLYCLQVEQPSLDVEVTPFAKSAQEVTEGPTFSKTLYTVSGPPIKSYGRCLWPTKVTLLVPSEETLTVGQTLEVRAVVEGADTERSGAIVPTGVVDIALEDGASCLASLDDEGVGLCTVLLQDTGSRTITAEYHGDRDFAPTTSETTIEVKTDLFSGSWTVTSVSTSSDETCSGGSTYSVVVSENAGAYSIQGAGIDTTATASGEELSFSVIASVPEDGGTTTIDMTGTFHASGTFTGSSSWSWTDGTMSCTGTSTFSGTRD